MASRLVAPRNRHAAQVVVAGCGRKVGPADFRVPQLHPPGTSRGRHGARLRRPPGDTGDVQGDSSPVFFPDQTSSPIPLDREHPDGVGPIHDIGAGGDCLEVCI
jgi:hypothetical protein